MIHSLPQRPRRGAIEASTLPASPYGRGLYAYAAFMSLLVTSMFVLNGCQLVEGIFKAGAWVGVIAVLMLLAVIGGVAALVRR